MGFLPFAYLMFCPLLITSDYFIWQNWIQTFNLTIYSLRNCLVYGRSCRNYSLKSFVSFGNNSVKFRGKIECYSSAKVGSCLEKLCPLSWVPPEAYSCSRAQFFPIRTSRLANNIFILFREQDIFTARITIVFFFSHMKTTIVMATGSLIKMVVFFSKRGFIFIFFLQIPFWLRSAYSWRKKFCFWSSDLRIFLLIIQEN